MKNKLFANQYSSCKYNFNNLMLYGSFYASALRFKAPLGKSLKARLQWHLRMGGLGRHNRSIAGGYRAPGAANRKA